MKSLLSHIIFNTIELMKKILTAVVALFAVLSAAGITLYNYATNLGKETIISHGIFEVHKGDSFAKVVTGLIGEQNDLRIRIYAYINPGLTHIKVATYDMADVNNLDEALAKLISGNGVQADVRLIPGRTWKQWQATFPDMVNVRDNIAKLDTTQVIKLLDLKPITGDTKFNNLEGYFAPNTYKIGFNAPITVALKLANDNLVAELNKVWASRNDRVQVKNPYELLILASIIEREKGNDAEASTISAVFNNRLARGMQLQTDPTVIYGMGDSYDGNITRKDLQTPTPYNTYTIKGLPPTPIAMVSENSLMAAAHPADVPYLYFVAIYGAGKHDFSRTYSEHQQKVRTYVKAYRQAN